MKKTVILVLITVVILFIGSFGIGNDVTLEFHKCKGTYRQYQIKPFIETTKYSSEDDALAQIQRCLCNNKETNKEAIRQFYLNNIYGTYPENNAIDTDVVCSGEMIFSEERILKDPWSINCTTGNYAIFSEEKYICEPLKPCTDNSGCKYLEIDKLPPRSGECIDGRCKAFCGSGIIREC